MTEVLDARETRLVAVSRENGELLEVNAHLKRYIISYMKKVTLGFVIPILLMGNSQN